MAYIEKNYFFITRFINPIDESFFIISVIIKKTRVMDDQRISFFLKTSGLSGL